MFRKSLIPSPILAREHNVVRWRSSAWVLRRLWWPLLVCVCACSTSEIDPDKLPYRLETGNLLEHNARAVDLDGDGRDEMYLTYKPGQPAIYNIQALVLQSQTTGVIDQVNFTGHIDTPLFRDLDADGTLEAFVPVLRNDSLFLTVVNADGRKHLSLFLISGQPRIEPDGVMPWDPRVEELAVHDFDGDGSQELISVIVTGFARRPRGVFVHRLRDGALLGQALVGAGIADALIDDFNGDGHPEVFLAAMGSNNGGDAGGFSDANAYLMVFDTWPVPTVKWHRQLPGKAFPTFARSDFDGDGRDEILVMSAMTPGRLEILDTRTWRTIRARDINQRIYISAAIDVDRDGLLEVVAPSPPNEILLIDDNLEIMARKRLSLNFGAAGSLPDLDGDGIAEIVVSTTFDASNGGFLLLGPKLELKAAVIEGWPAGVLRAGAGAPPGVIVHRPNQSPDLLKLSRNRMYLVNRFAPRAASAAGAGLLALAGLSFFRYRNRYRLLLALRGTALDRTSEGLQLVNRRGQILWMNTTLARWCGQRDTNGGNAVSRIHQLPEPLHRFCGEALSCVPPRQLATDLHLTLEPGGFLGAAQAEPVFTGLANDPHWLIRVRNGSASSELTAAWVPLARRTAHDLRNPLTSILLTLQRLQMEYRATAPEAAPKLDAYTNRLQQRVDQLRRLASNLLKLLGDEKPHLEKHDLNAIARGSVAAIGAGLPPDLRLELRAADDLPDVVIDREQLESVLENLVANAINAMPEGGVITVSTHLARGLPIRNGQNGDCVQLEVLDTGVGIDPAVLPRIFEPGFSTRDQGSGLGLAIVRKIVEDHGGEVSVASEVGTGTAFTILLPVASATPHHVAV